MAAADVPAGITLRAGWVGFDCFRALRTVRRATGAGLLARFREGRAARVVGFFAALFAALFDAFLAAFFDDFAPFFDAFAAFFGALFAPFVFFALFFDAFDFALFFDAFDLAMGEPLRPLTAAQAPRKPRGALALTG
jgi:hypothetical protein